MAELRGNLYIRCGGEGIYRFLRIEDKYDAFELVFYGDYSLWLPFGIAYVLDNLETVEAPITGPGPVSNKASGVRTPKTTSGIRIYHMVGELLICDGSLDTLSMTPNRAVVLAGMLMFVFEKYNPFMCINVDENEKTTEQWGRWRDNRPLPGWETPMFHSSQHPASIPIAGRTLF